MKSVILALSVLFLASCSDSSSSSTTGPSIGDIAKGGSSINQPIPDPSCTKADGSDKIVVNNVPPVIIVPPVVPPVIPPPVKPPHHPKPPKDDDDDHDHDKDKKCPHKGHKNNDDPHPDRGCD